jgi:hypothetical protein
MIQTMTQTITPVKKPALLDLRGLTPNVGANPCGCPRLGRHKALPLPREIPKTQKTLHVSGETKRLDLKNWSLRQNER